MYLPVEELLPWEKFRLNSANGGGKKMGTTSTYVSPSLSLGYLTWLMVKRNVTEVESSIYGEGQDMNHLYLLSFVFMNQW